ncbi:kelch domain-containing protein 10-like [Saccoglossus kowalevskii]|uniref:Kelch domain-containing protein 10-like n=1 Tax=Saccoglossus kowalevskii TaxID=10224 RepID=A0ABM0H015_SACKO|nr:PREDICTED: kelch domain-containing protein 10-like [Saccoglossus kowalevskii]
MISAAVLRSGNLYVFGGCRKIANDNFHFDAELYKLNLESCIWEKLAGSECSNEIQPEGMYRHGIACDDHKLYVLGYSWSEVYTIPHLHKIYAYDLKLSMWESLSTHPDYLKGFPPTRIYHSCAQRNNDVFISGGHNNSLIYDDLWRLNLTTLQWTSLNKLPIKSFFHTASITPSGCMYYFGGVTKLDDSSRTGETYRIWLEVPSLFELCWYHVSSLIPDLDSLSDERLITLGIPRSLIGRVRAG